MAVMGMRLAVRLARLVLLNLQDQLVGSEIVEDKVFFIS